MVCKFPLSDCQSIISHTLLDNWQREMVGSSHTIAWIVMSSDAEIINWFIKDLS